MAKTTAGHTKEKGGGGVGSPQGKKVFIRDYREGVCLVPIGRRKECLSCEQQEGNEREAKVRQGTEETELCVCVCVSHMCKCVCGCVCGGGGCVCVGVWMCVCWGGG